MYSRQNDNSVIKKDNKISKKNLYFSCHTNKLMIFMMTDSSRKFISAFCKPSTMRKEMASYQSPREEDWLVPQSFYLTIFKLDPSLKLTPRLGSYCTWVILFDYL